MVALRDLLEVQREKGVVVADDETRGLITQLEDRRDEAREDLERFLAREEHMEHGRVGGEGVRNVLEPREDGRRLRPEHAAEG